MYVIILMIIHEDLVMMWFLPLSSILLLSPTLLLSSTLLVRELPHITSSASNGGGRGSRAVTKMMTLLFKLIE